MTLDETYIEYSSKKDEDDYLLVESSPGLSYFLPKIKKLGGTVDVPEGVTCPKIFTPLTIKNTTFFNRIGVSPMCMYSCAHEGSQVGMATPLHFAHYGSFALRGVGLIIIEMAAVTPTGRLSPEDLAIYTDDQALKLKEIVDFAHSQGVKIGLQIGHGGRKASGTPTYIECNRGIGKKHHGWADIKGAVVAPSPISFDEARYTKPSELTVTQIHDLVQSFKVAAKRAYEISGFDFIEIHGAHGYLISSFLSATSNKRSDEYGGSFENRIRFLLEIIDAVHSDEHPLFVRISGSELLEGTDPEGWTIEDSIKLSDELIKHKVDVLDVSSGGNDARQARRKNQPGWQVPLAKAVKDHVGDKLLIAAVGGLADAQLANKVVEENSADIILNARGFLKNPGLAMSFADELGVKVHSALQFVIGPRRK